LGARKNGNGCRFAAWLSIPWPKGPRPFACAGYFAHPFVKWMALVLISPFFSQL
jgi:hypothetical protein